VTLELFGCTDKDLAGREANLIAAAQKYRRRFVSFETDFEGMVANRGEVVLVSHDLFAMQQASSWGHSGRLVAGTTTQLVLDRTVPGVASTTQYVGVRFPDNTFHVAPVTPFTGESATLALAAPLPSAPDGDPDNPVVDYLWFYGLDAAGPAKRMKVDSVDVLSERAVRLTCVDETAVYYDHETAPYAYTPPAPQPGVLPVISNLHITEERVEAGSGYAVQLTLTWDIEGIYSRANIRASINSGPLQQMGSTPARRFAFTVPEDAAVLVEVSALHPLYGVGPQGRITGLRDTIAVIELPAPEVTVYASPDAAGAVRRIKVRLTLDSAIGVRPDALALMFAIDAAPRTAVIDADEGARVRVQAFNLLSSGTAGTIRSGSTVTRLIVRDATDPLSTTINLAGMFWGQFGASQWRKCTGYDAVAFEFREPFDVAPQPGDILNYAEISWFDERAPQWRLASLSRDGAVEIVRWTRIEQVADRFYVAGLSRAQEGTAQIDAAGATLGYYPAPGAGSELINIPFNLLAALGDNIYEGETDVNLSLPENYWLAMTAATYYNVTGGRIVRSPIVPLIYGGPL
jgi:hypothetical protein